MKLFSTLQARLALVIAALAITGVATSQTMQVNGAACTNASVTIANGIVNLVVPQTCGGSTAVAPAITAFTPPNGTAGAAYASYSFVATGSPNPTWSATGLPSGLTLSSGGVLTGTPSTAGTSNVTVTATNTAGTDSKAITITIDAPSGPPVIGAATVPQATINQVYSYQFTAGGAQPITWGLAAGSTLPSGVTLTTVANAGILSGTPTQSGSFAFAVTAANSVSTVTSPIYSLVVNAVATLAITAQSPATTATTGTAYTAYTFQANPSTNLTWSTTGALPPGLSLAPSTGVLSGTPTTAGTYNFTVSVTNGSASATSNSITITVGAGSCTTGLSTDGFCMQDPSRTANKITTATENGRLKGPPQAALPQLDAYSVDAATACNASQAAAGSSITNRWQHNIDFVSFRKGQTLEEYGMPPRHAITYRFVAGTDPALPSTGAIQIEGASVYTGVATMSSITTSPCELDTAMLTTTDFTKRFCYSSIGSLRYEVTSGAATLGYCKLTPGTTYYFTMRFLDPATKQDSCTTGTCGGIFQLR